jgi:phage major head subunit gpT-like protein
MPAGNLYTSLDDGNILQLFHSGLTNGGEQIWAPQISIEVPSDRVTETLTWLGQVPQMRPWVGGRKETPLNKYTMSITNFPYEVTLPISNRDRNNDKTGSLSQRITDLGVRTQTHWNVLVGGMIAAGDAGTQGLAYDGQYFFDTDHNESGSNQKNSLGASEVPSSNVATTTTLTTTEAAAVITETVAYMMSLTDDQGQPINQDIKQVLIICTKVGHYNGIKTALGLNNLGTGSGNNNPLLAWVDVSFSVKYVPQRVTAADKLYFFFGSPNTSASPLIRTVEQDIRTNFKDETFDNDRMVFGVDAKRGVGFGTWQNAAMVTLT